MIILPQSYGVTQLTPPSWTWRVLVRTLCYSIRTPTDTTLSAHVFVPLDNYMQSYSVTRVHCLIPSRHVGRAPGCYPFSNAVQFPSVDAYPKCISFIPYVWLYCHAWGYVRSCTCFYKRKRRGSREYLIFFSVSVCVSVQSSGVGSGFFFILLF